MATFDFNEFVVERFDHNDGDGDPVYVEVPSASFSATASYDPDDNGTLIVQGDRGTLSVSWYGEQDWPCKVGDRIRVRYTSRELHLMVVTNVSYDRSRRTVDDRYDFKATALETWFSYYASTPITVLASLPAESWADRLARFDIEVTGI